MTALAPLALLAAAAPPALAPLDAYAGHCWIATIASGTTDRHCFERVYGGAHVRDRHVVRQAGKPVYEGETLYSAEGGRIIFTYWNSLGGVGHGTAVAQGESIAFTLSMRATPDAAAQADSITWRRTPGGYETVSGAATRRFILDDRVGGVAVVRPDAAKPRRQSARGAAGRARRRDAE